MARSKTAAADRTDNEPGRRAWYFMMELVPYLRGHFTAMAADFDLTPPQALALRRLQPGQTIPMNRIAEALACDASNVTGIVDKLEARKLIERQASPDDRRVKMIALTPTGATLRERLIERISEPLPAMLALEPADQRTLAQLLERMLAAQNR